MVKIFNSLTSTTIGQLLTLKNLPEIERFEVLKAHIRNYCMWSTLGLPGDWPENKEEALLDRCHEIYGLGIESDTTSEE